MGNNENILEERARTMHESRFLGYQKNEPKYLTQEELTAFFMVIEDPRDVAMFNLTYKYGLRASEIGLLKVEDINFETNMIIVHRLKNSGNQLHQCIRDIQPWCVGAAVRKPLTRKVKSNGSK